MPRVVICGEASLPNADTERLPLADVKVAVVPAAGHAMAWQNPSGLALALQRALA
jgi:pimeloyl-ACP methyl ester carboxylesterase